MTSCTELHYSEVPAAYCMLGFISKHGCQQSDTLSPGWRCGGKKQSTFCCAPPRCWFLRWCHLSHWLPASKVHFFKQEWRLMSCPQSVTDATNFTMLKLKYCCLPKVKYSLSLSVFNDKTRKSIRFNAVSSYVSIKPDIPLIIGMIYLM